MRRSTLLAIACLALISNVAGVSAQQPGIVPPNSVIACDGTEYMGRCETFTLEPAMRHVLVPNSASLKGKISSIAVGENLEIWVFTGLYFSGPSTVISRNTGSFEAPPIGLSGNNPGMIQTYPFPWSIRLKDPSKPVTLGGGVKMGGFDPLTGPANQDWNDRIQSFIVYPRGSEPPGVHILGKGLGSLGPIGKPAPPISRFFPMPEDSGTLRMGSTDLFDFDDQALFIRVPPSVEAVLYDQPSLKGNQLKVPGAAGAHTPDSAFKNLGWNGELDPNSGHYSYPHWYALNRYQFDGKTSSLVVRVRGWNMGMEAPERGGEGDSSRHRAPPAQQPGMGQVGKVLSVDGGGLQTVEVQSLETSPDLDQLTLEPGTNRPGHDYRNFPLAQLRADNCRAACAADAKCQAFTYVNPGSQGDLAHCWLKSTAAPAEPAACCVSGARKPVN